MFTLNCKGRLLIIEKPLVMGIINVTPDSFYASSRKVNEDAVLQKTEQMITEGATIIDIGGQSTRPGAKQINATEEAERVLPFIEAITKHFPQIFISVDTFDATVAKQATGAGASMINDISGGNFDADMLSEIASLHVPYICMHTKGNFSNMHQNPEYENVTKEVLDFFIAKKEECRLAGIHDIIVDPGFGFSKSSEHNFELLRNLPVLKTLQKPLLAGISRKSTIYKTLGISADEALNGTTVLHTIALLNGTNMLRVHDVKEAAEAITLVEEYAQKNSA